MNLWLILLVLVLGLGLLWLVSRKRRLNDADIKIVVDQWNKIEDLYNQERFKEAILEADKTFDFVLKRMNLKGSTMGERLKNAKSFMPNYQDIWYAHKVRNQLVHKVNYHIDSASTSKVLGIFRKTIRKLNIL